MTLRVGLWYKSPLAGLYCASGYVIQGDKYDSKDKLGGHVKENRPIRIWHGVSDPTVPLAFTKVGVDKLQELGVKDNLNVKYEKGLGHSMSDEEMRDLVQFIKANLMEKKPKQKEKEKEQEKKADGAEPKKEI